jgi:hypothetical protein
VSQTPSPSLARSGFAITIVGTKPIEMRVLAAVVMGLCGMEK